MSLVAHQPPDPTDATDGAEPREQVVTTDEGRFLVLFLPLADHEATGFDRPWKKVFLEWLHRGVSIKAAAELAGITREQAHRCRHTDELFRNAWDLVKGRKGERSHVLPNAVDFDRPWKRVFLGWLSRGVNITMAAKLTGITRKQAHRCRHTDELFRNAWDFVIKEKDK